MKIHFKFFGLYISNASGNCFAPAIQYHDKVLTLRTKDSLETKIFWKRKLGWDSEHIAFHWGKCVMDGSHDIYPSVWEYQGILGKHDYIC